MNKILKLEKIINNLTDEEYREFKKRFLEIDWKKWDQQIEKDAQSGKLDFLIHEVHRSKKEDRLKIL
jgi:hypothetical protein